jgi:hypothetical protein
VPLAADEAVAANEAEIRTFLEVITAQAQRTIGDSAKPGLLLLTSIQPDGKPVIMRYKLDDVDRMAKDAIDYASSGYNVYVEGRTVRADLEPGKRGGDADTAWVFALVGDHDCYEDKKVMSLPPGVVPSLQVESSPGSLHHWFFLQAAVRWQEAKALGADMKAATGGDSKTFCLAQPYRVAGTPNYPNKKKLAAGRSTVPAVTCLAGGDGDTWTPDQLREVFVKPAGKEKAEARGGADGASHHSNPVAEANVDAETLNVIKHGLPDGDDRSQAFFRVVRDLKEEGHAVDPIYQLLNQYPNGIAAKYDGRLFDEVERAWTKIALAYDDTGGEAAVTADQLKAMRKQAKRDRKAVIAELNRQYMVTVDGSKTWVLRDATDPDHEGRQVFHYMKLGDLRDAYANRFVVTRIDDKGGKSKKPIVEFWHHHPDRRQYIGGVVFDPSPDYKSKADVLNLWRGFNVKPVPGDWTLLRTHMLGNLCGGNRDYFDYLMGWLATLVQRPGDPGQVAVVLRGNLGTGKGVFGHAVRHLFGRHGMHIANSKHLVGNFNAHLRDCCVLFADEAFFAGDKAAVGVLKSLVTESVITVEGKFKDAIQCKNRLHVIMASNNEWVVPAATDERRFFVLDVADTRMQDSGYFAAIDAQLKAGGYEAMLHELLHRDISGFNVRQVPDTAALRDQKAHSLKTEEAWWQDVLERGYVYKSKLGLEDHFGDWHEWVATEVLVASYEDYARAHGDRYLLSRVHFGRFMAKVAKYKQLGGAGVGVVGEHVLPVISGMGERAAVVEKHRPAGYQLGDIDAARDAFARVVRLAP